MEPTLTDSYVILGYMNPKYLLGGDFALNAEKAHRIYREKVAKQLDRDVVEAAYGVYEIANSNIRRAITAVSSERGRDPRKFSLLVFGGAAAIHGASVARTIGMREVIIAPLAGLFSAYGLLCADVQRMYVKSFDAVLEPGTLVAADTVLEDMARDAVATARQHGYVGDSIQIEKQADLRYQRQQSELTLPLPQSLKQADVATIQEQFHKEYESTFGFRLSNTPIEIVNVRVSSTIPIKKPTRNGSVRTFGNGAETTSSRQAFFGPEYGMMAVPVKSVEQIRGVDIPGPVLIDTYDSTIVVPPATNVRSSHGNLVIALH